MNFTLWRVIYRQLTGALVALKNIMRNLDQRTHLTSAHTDIPLLIQPPAPNASNGFIFKSNHTRWNQRNICHLWCLISGSHEIMWESSGWMEGSWLYIGHLRKSPNRKRRCGPKRPATWWIAYLSSNSSQRWHRLWRCSRSVLKKPLECYSNIIVYQSNPRLYTMRCFWWNMVTSQRRYTCNMNMLQNAKYWWQTLVTVAYIG